MGSSWLEKLLEIRPEEVPERPAKNPVLCYKTRTVKSGSMVEVECYPVYEYRYRRELERTRPASAAVKAVNEDSAVEESAPEALLDLLGHHKEPPKTP